MGSLDAVPHDDAVDGAPGPGLRWRRGEEPEFSRLLTFTDAVFAIGMTLLALDLRVDRVIGDTSSPSAMWQALGDLTPKLIAFVVAFWVLAVYWRSHHRFMARIGVIDARLVTLTLVYLAVVAVLPLPTSLIGEYVENPVSGVVFAVTLATISLLEVAMLVHAQRRDLWRHDGVEPGDLRSEQDEVLESLSPALIFLATAPLAFVSPTVMLLSWAVLGPGTGLLHRRWSQRHRGGR